MSFQERRTGEPTPGEWIFDPGDNGDDSVGLAPTPPTISVAAPEDSANVEDLTLALLLDPSYRVNTPPTDEWDEGIQSAGSLAANGLVMAGAKELLACLCERVDAFWGDWPESLRAEFRKYYPAHSIVRAEAAIRKATTH